VREPTCRLIAELMAVVLMLSTQIVTGQSPIPVNVGGILTDQLIAPSISNSNVTKVTCTGTYSYTYEVVAFDAVGGTTGPASGSGTVTSACALGSSGTDFVSVSAPIVAGAAGCTIYRTASTYATVGTGKIGTVPCGQTFNDLGLTGDGTSPPSVNTTGNVQTGSTGVYLLSNDTGISRDSAGVFDFGTGTQGNKQGMVNAQAFNAAGSGAGTDILTNGSPLSSCGTPPCISSTGEFFQQAPTTILTSWGITWPSSATSNLLSGPFIGPFLFGSASGTPNTSSVIIGTLSNPANSELGTVSGTLTTYQPAAWSSSGDLIAQRGICSQTPSSDQITVAGAFATTCSIGSTGLAVGSFLLVRAHGVYTTTGTAGPLMNLARGKCRWDGGTMSTGWYCDIPVNRHIEWLLGADLLHRDTSHWSVGIGRSMG
jgi:hypothetical protein